MSTQGGHSVPLAILAEDHHQSFRLLQLPEELLTLLTSENPPVLQLKSSEGTPGQAKDSTAALCTPTKTYHIRQVNHSNSVYITQPTTTTTNSLSDPGIEAIAKSGYTLEINPVAKTVSAAPFIKAILPVYISTTQIEPRDPITKQQLFSNVPLSGAECEHAWRELTCFESASPQGCFRPSAKAKLDTWLSILNQATASGIDLTSPKSTENEDLIIDPNEDWPIELSQAVLNSLCADTTEGRQFDKDKCVRQIGAWQLEALTQGIRSTPRAEFLNAWSDALPEKWRVEAKLDALKGLYTLAGNGKAIEMVPDTAGASASETTSLGAKRKWHEKLRPSKKTA